MLQIYKFIVDKKTKGRSFMLFFCLMLATTVSLAQNGAKITIKKNSISVIEALKEVEKQSGMSVSYNDSTEREIYHDYSGTKERKQPDQKDHR